METWILDPSFEIKVIVFGGGPGGELSVIDIVDSVSVMIDEWVNEEWKLDSADEDACVCVLVWFPIDDSTRGNIPTTTTPPMTAKIQTTFNVHIRILVLSSFNDTQAEL